ncbi:DUF167 domain-containing protein [Ahrensia sp. AH-315-G08]|nr:DUF167 domain-containing protein [Ahrensia sp. AH-315-G08]
MKNTIKIRVTPKASSNRVVKGSEQEAADYKIYVTTVPEDGKANKAVLKLLAKELGVAKSSLIILKGETNRDKLIQVE